MNERIIERAAPSQNTPPASADARTITTQNLIVLENTSVRRILRLEQDTTPA